MASNDDLIDYIKTLAITGIGIAATLIIGKYTGFLNRIKEQGKKEIEQVRKESSFEQTDAVYDVLLKNITDQLTNIQKNHNEITKSINTIDKDVAVLKTTVTNQDKTIENLTRKVEDGMRDHNSGRYR
jgi:septation ring formation regulator EzrA